LSFERDGGIALPFYCRWLQPLASLSLPLEQRARFRAAWSSRPRAPTRLASIPAEASEGPPNSASD
jgi:hypothetical protein